MTDKIDTNAMRETAKQKYDNKMIATAQKFNKATKQYHKAITDAFTAYIAVIHEANKIERRNNNESR